MSRVDAILAGSMKGQEHSCRRWYVTMSSASRPVCLCECGEVPKLKTSKYITGHDLVHAQRLIEEALAGGNHEMLHQKLSSDGLRSKFDELFEARS